MISSVLQSLSELSKLAAQNDVKVNLPAIALIFILTSAAINIICFVFKGIGLSTIAKREGHKNTYLAYIPFASYFLLGKIVGGVKVFGYRVKNLGLVAMISMFSYYVLNGLYEGFLYGENIVSLVTTGELGVLPSLYGNVWIDVVLNVLMLAASVVYIIADVFLMLTFFMYYGKKYQILYSLLSIFFEPVFGILVFVVRKRERFDYSQYMKMRFDSYNANRSGGGFNNPQEPFTRDDNGPYAQYETKRQNSADDIDVFEDYSDKKTTDKKEDDLF